MDDSPAYLQPGFDPNNLRVAELRGILVEHDIDYPASAKKSQLVDLFNDNIAPKSKRLLSAKNRVKPSARGIVDVEQYDYDPEEPEEPVYEEDLSRSTRRGARTSMRRSIAPEESPVRTPARRTRPSEGVPQSTRRISDRVPDLEPPRQTIQQERPDYSTPKPQKKKSRKSLSAVLNSPQDEDSDDGEDEVFTKQNPFQMGSPALSPRAHTPGDATVKRRSLISPDKRRVSAATPSRPLRMSLPAYTEKQLRTPTSNRVDSGLSTPDHTNAQLQREQEVQHETYEDEEDFDYSDDQTFEEPHEEFAPNAAAEETRPVVKRKRQAAPRPPKGIFGFLLISLFSAFFFWWRKEKIAVGYCGVGQYDGPTGPITASNFYLPRCELCPPHAICKPDFETECQDDYVLVPNKYSLAGLIPIAPTCEADSEKLRRIAVLSNEAVRILRKRAADVKCGDAKLDKDENEGISESKLKNELYKLKSPKLSDEQFNELWRNALEDVAQRDEIIAEQVDPSAVQSDTTETDTPSKHTLLTTPHDPTKTYLRSTSLSSMSITCTLRLSLLTLLSRLSLFLAPVFALGLLTIYYRRRSAQKKELTRQITKNALFALQTLAKQKRLNEEDPRRYKDDFVAIVQLRDQVLQHEFDPKRREKLWEGVRKVVELNSNVRVRMKEVQGEPMKCWSWVGGTLVGTVDDASDQGFSTAGPQMAEMKERPLVGAGRSMRRDFKQESDDEEVIDKEERERQQKREERLAEIRREREARRGF